MILGLCYGSYLCGVLTMWTIVRETGTNREEKPFLSIMPLFVVGSCGYVILIGIIGTWICNWIVKIVSGIWSWFKENW